jgi:hypothetical protein
MSQPTVAVAPGLEAARHATVEIWNQAASRPEDRHRGQGLLLPDLDGHGPVVLTCHHVIAPVTREGLTVRVPDEQGTLGETMPATYDAQHSQPAQDAVVLRLPQGSVAARPRPRLHRLNPDRYTGSLRAIGLTYLQPATFGADVEAATPVEVPVRIPGAWPDPRIPMFSGRSFGWRGPRMPSLASVVG